MALSEEYMDRLIKAGRMAVNDLVAESEALPERCDALRRANIFYSVVYFELTIKMMMMAENPERFLADMLAVYRDQINMLKHAAQRPQGAPV